jgi:glc operon protein GlcG
MESISLEEAQQILARAVEKAKTDFGRPICASICDKYGFLVAFFRMDGAPVRSIEISQRKAYTAARMGVSTDAFLARLHREQIEASAFGDDHLTALPGGNLLKDGGGAVLGAVGVSGLAASEDQAITEAMGALALRAG